MLSVLANKYDETTIKTVDYVLKSIDYKKLARRAAYADEFRYLEVKCNLLDYAHTTMWDVKNGHPNIVSYIPNTGVMANSALNSSPVLELLSKILSHPTRAVHIYTRSKIDHTKGLKHTHMRELMLMFDPEEEDNMDETICHCREDD